MTNFQVSQYLIENYETYYEAADQTWRELGAVDKCNNILRLCSELPHDSVLEIGAGDGAILKRLSSLGFGTSFSALEIATSAVDHISQLGIPSLIECRQFDGYNIPYPDKSFDLVIMSHVLEHVEYPRKLIYEAERVAKNVFIEVPLEDNLRLREDFVFTKTGHINSYAPKTIRRLVQSCRMEIKKVLISNPAKDVLKYRYGQKGVVQFYIREALLRGLPKLAPRIFNYHLSLTYTGRQENW